MGDTSEFSLTIRLFLKAYQWRKIDPVPWTPLKKPLSQSKLALVSSAGFVLPDQPHFDESIKGGDPSFREIPSGVEVKTLVETHRSESFDHTGLQKDPNLGFPIDRIRELAACGADRFRQSSPSFLHGFHHRPRPSDPQHRSARRASAGRGSGGRAILVPV